MRELTARVRAVLRRVAKQNIAAEILRLGGITLDHAGRTVKVNCAAGSAFIDLTPSEFDILAVLMGAPGRAFTRAELLDRLQGAYFEGYERTIDVHIRNLRKKLKPHDEKHKYIETVYGTGYRFAPQR
jgi:DNA-binding response OmpR family regulator